MDFNSKTNFKRFVACRLTIYACAFIKYPSTGPMLIQRSNIIFNEQTNGMVPFMVLGKWTYYSLCSHHFISIYNLFAYNFNISHDQSTFLISAMMWQLVEDKCLYVYSM